MLENRPIVPITIGYIIGIILGLYLKTSIVLFYAILCIITKIIKSFNRFSSKKFKVISVKRYIRYIKLIAKKRVIILVVISSVISNTIVLYQNSNYNKIYKLENSQYEFQGKIISNLSEKKYYNLYKIKIISKTNSILQKKNFYLRTNKKIKLNYGDIVKFTGTINIPQTAKNYKGFNYREYLKTLKISGVLKSENLEKISTESTILSYMNNISNSLKKRFDKSFNKDIANIYKAILLGDATTMNDEVEENFSESNISHILAISGMHIGYIILLCMFLEKIVGRKLCYFLTIVFIIFYSILIGFHTSALRAIIMAVLAIGSKLIYKKNDIWTDIFFSLLILLIYNPYLIKDIGLLLSYFGVISIVSFNKLFRNIQNNVLRTIYMTIFINITLIPILAIGFNKIPLVGIITSIIISSIMVVPVLIIGFIFLIFKNEIIINLAKFIANIILKSAEISSKVPFSKIYVVTPYLINVILYYIIFAVIVFVYIIKHSEKKTAFIIRFKNLISHFKYRIRINKQKIISIFLCISILVSIIKIIPKNLKIYFVDVGQGDCSLIISPHNKKILVDGGGSLDYDVGKNILLPYFLDRRIKKLDYIIISHFDTDHSQSYAKILPELTASRIFITEQIEENDLFKQIMVIAKEKNIKVTYVKAGDIINIDGVKFSILHPQKELITNNGMNNNSMVCKLEYKSFSMLFTGDIEKEAEELILSKNTNLKADVLKVAHHRFKNFNNGRIFKSSIS